MVYVLGFIGCVLWWRMFLVMAIPAAIFWPLSLPLFLLACAFGNATWKPPEQILYDQRRQKNPQP